MGLVYEAASSKKALEKALKRDPEGSHTVKKVSPGKYAVTTKYGTRKQIHTRSERVVPQGEKKQTKVIYKTGGRTIIGTATVQELSQSQVEAFADAQPEALALTPSMEADRKAQELERQGVLRRQVPGVSQDPRLQGETYVKRPGPYKSEHQYIPLEQYERQELAKMSVQEREFAGRMHEGMTTEELQKAAVPTVAEKFVEQARRPGVAQVRKGHPEDIPGAVFEKVGQWGVEAVAGVLHPLEIASRPESHKALGVMAGRPEMLFMAGGGVAKEMVEYAAREPAEFVGMTAVSFGIFSGVKAAAVRGKAAFQVKAGPKIAEMTKGRVMGRVTKQYKAFKPEEYGRGIHSKTTIGHGELFVERVRNKAGRTKTDIPMDRFRELVKEGQREKIDTFYQEGGLEETIRSKTYTPKVVHARAELELLSGKETVVKRSIYTYIKERPPETVTYSLKQSLAFEHDLMTPSRSARVTLQWNKALEGGRRGHVRHFEPIPKTAKIPVRYSSSFAERTGYGVVEREFGRFEMLIKPHKPKVRDMANPLMRKRKAGSMKPFDPVGDDFYKPVSSGARARAESFMAGERKGPGRRGVGSKQSTQLRTDMKPQATFEQPGEFVFEEFIPQARPGLIPGFHDTDMRADVRNLTQFQSFDARSRSASTQLLEQAQRERTDEAMRISFKMKEFETSRSREAMAFRSVQPQQFKQSFLQIQERAFRGLMPMAPLSGRPTRMATPPIEFDLDTKPIKRKRSRKETTMGYGNITYPILGVTLI